MLSLSRPLSLSLSLALSCCLWLFLIENDLADSFGVWPQLRLGHYMWPEWGVRALPKNYETTDDAEHHHDDDDVAAQWITVSQWLEGLQSPYRSRVLCLCISKVFQIISQSTVKFSTHTENKNNTQSDVHFCLSDEMSYELRTIISCKERSLVEELLNHPPYAFIVQ